MVIDVFVSLDILSNNSIALILLIVLLVLFIVLLIVLIKMQVKYRNFAFCRLLSVH